MEPASGTPEPRDPAVDLRAGPGAARPQALLLTATHHLPAGQRPAREHLADQRPERGDLVPWPIFATLGWGPGIANGARNAFGSDGYSEAQIQAEMRRLGGD